MTTGRPLSTFAERHICALLAIISLTQAYHLSANDDAAQISASGALLLQTKATQKSGMTMPGSSFFEEDAVQAAPQLQKLPDIPMMAPHDVGSYAVPVLAPEETSLMAFADQSPATSGSNVNMEDPDSGPIAVEPPLPSSSDLLPSHIPSALGQLQARTGQSADFSRWRLKAAAERASRKPEEEKQEGEESNEQNRAEDNEEAEKDEEKVEDEQNEESTEKEQSEDEESSRRRKRKSEHEAYAKDEINVAKDEEAKGFEEEVKTEEGSGSQNNEYEEAGVADVGYAHASASISRAAHLAPEHGGHCIPTCTWKCDSQKCDEDCEPVCQAPRCETRCAGISTAGCSMECTKPHCAVMCAKTMCSGGGCPECATKCSEPQCKLKCPKSKACKNVCEQPHCDWKCKAPLHCPKPKCQMFCESPKKCHSARFSQQLPPLQAGQMGVPSFAASRLKAESGMVDVDVLSHALPRWRQVSLPVLPYQQRR